MLVLGEDGQDVAVDAPSDAYLTLGGFGFRASWGRAAFMSASACIMGASICINGMYPPATSSTPFTRKPNSVSFEHTSEHVMHVRTEAALNPKPRRFDRDSRRKRRVKKKKVQTLGPQAQGSSSSHGGWSPLTTRSPATAPSSPVAGTERMPQCCSRKD